MTHVFDRTQSVVEIFSFKLFSSHVGAIPSPHPCGACPVQYGSPRVLVVRGRLLPRGHTSGIFNFCFDPPIKTWDDKWDAVHWRRTGVARQAALHRSCYVLPSCTASQFLQEKRGWKPWRPKRFFQFEIIINVLVSSFRFIWTPMSWVYGHYKYFNSYSAGIDFSRQNLPSTDVRFWRLKSIPAL